MLEPRHKMKKKQQKTQLILISIGLLLILLTYFYYPYMNKDKLLEDQFVLEDLEKTLDDDKVTSFENIEYEGLFYLNKPFSGKALCEELGIDIVYNSRQHSFSTTELRKRVHYNDKSERNLREKERFEYDDEMANKTD